ncbi:TC1A [Hepatospora eriocheir]|uniref:TC1A n=1 Tax=Hepatospora eriocheir TaxID=1081669 RepID=A0A1X0QIT8_9MICR|nr:TC1A [Hepatospora eriocheir]
MKLLKIIYSDKVKINLFTNDRARYVRYYLGEKHNKKNIMPIVKHGGGCVMVWSVYHIKVLVDQYLSENLR